MIRLMIYYLKDPKLWEGIFLNMYIYIWVVVKIMVPFWVLIIILHLIFRVPKRGHNFDNYPYG